MNRYFLEMMRYILLNFKDLQFSFERSIFHPGWVRLSPERVGWEIMEREDLQQVYIGGMYRPGKGSDMPEIVNGEREPST